QDLTLLHRREWKSLPKQNHKASRKNMITVRTDPIPMMMERSAAMLIMFPKSERTTQLLERERKSARQVYQDNQRNMMNIRRGDPILVMIEMTSVMLIMVPKRRRKDYSASGKRKEERQASLPRQSKEHEEHKKRGCYTRDDRNDLCDADNGSKERKDYSAAGKRKEERQASLPRQSKEHDEHKKRGSYTPDDRDDPRDADNGSKERNDYSASRKRMEDYRAKSSRQSNEHDDDKKRGSYTPDDRSHRSDADNRSRERGDFSASGQRKEEYLGKSPRQLKEHGDNKKRGSYTPADRNDLRDVDNGCNEKLATDDGSRSPCPGRRSPRPS
uniref:Uncharacterized protein n=1 Tax=Aegilops tauschii subsp. strangulata TaxID=200361 RepID=A0A453HTF8_AEGTS